MLGLLLIYFIGKAFYDLADKYEKSKWVFAILGVVSYYAGTILFGVVAALIDNGNWILRQNDIVIMVVSIPIGLITCSILYFALKHNWKKNAVSPDELLEEFGKS